MPKVIQIAVEGATADADTTLFALTDDGRIFMKIKVGYTKEEPWKLVEPIATAEGAAIAV